MSTLAELDALLGRLDTDQVFPENVLGVPRGRTGSPRRVTLPYGWLDDPDDDAVVLDAPEVLGALSGG